MFIQEQRQGAGSADAPEMHQTRKGYQPYFGMKAHTGVDSRSMLIQSVVVMAAYVHDSQVLDDLPHGGETRGWRNSAYSGQKDVLREHAPRARDFTQKKGSRHRSFSDEEQASKRSKSRVRSKVEHVVHVMLRQFDYTKVRYRVRDKTAHHLFIKCALVNRVLLKRRLMRLPQAKCA